MTVLIVFQAACAPTKAGSVAAPVTTSVFYVRAVSKLNPQALPRWLPIP